MPVSIEQFLDYLATSGLVPRDQVHGTSTWLGDAERQWDVETLAKEFVSRGTLTPYQAMMLKRGKPDGLVIGDYVVLDKIGAGGMGEVFKAVHRRMDRVVAIKVLSPEATKSEDLVARFQREIRAVARLEHPNIVTAYDAGEFRGIHFLVMQHIEGCDLSIYVKEQRGCLPIDEALDYLIQAARGLEHAHNEGIIHRDVKPSNLLLDRRGVVKLLDLGLAVFTEGSQSGDVADRRLTVAGERLGTANYMPPEQALDTRATDARSDIYSLGCTMHFLLTGDPPFRRPKKMQVVAAHQNAPVPSLCDLFADIPPALDAVFQRMMAKKPEERYQTMREARCELDHVKRSGLARRSIQIGPDDADVDHEGSTVTMRKAELKRALSARGVEAGGIEAGGGKAVVDPAAESGRSDSSNSDNSAVLEISARQGKSGQSEPHAPDRDAAQWVLAMGGGVVIVEIDGRRRRVNDLDDLPVTPFVLETVGLAYNQLVADADLTRFADVAQLRRMYLDGTNISDDALRHLPGIASLSHVALGNTKITDAGVQSIVECKTLRQISLYGTHVTDACVPALIQLRKLEKLNLCRTQLSTEAVAQLRSALPRCEVVY
jgi:serine/threonine protein kinase